MSKNIKKSLKYFIIFIGIIIILPTLLYLILRIPEVQTLIVKRITGHFSNEIKSTITVGKVEFQFFNKLNLSDILIEDKYSDTLLYSEKLSLTIRRIDIKNRFYRFGQVDLINPVVSFVTDSAGEMNLTWYLNMLKTSGDSVKTSKSSIVIDKIEINNARFSLINQTGIESKSIIDFNNLKLAGINGSLGNFKVYDDTTSFKIFNLGFRESNGFMVQKMSTSAVISKQDFLFNSTQINCDSSILNFSRLEIQPDSLSSFKNFAEKVRLDIVLEKSLISSSDLKYFIPFSKGANESVWLSGKAYGTISELRGRNIEMSYRDNTYLDCNFDFSGLTNIENAFIYIGVNSLKTNANDLDKIDIPGKGRIKVPEVLYKLGNIYFDGSFTGFITDFVTYGKIRTDQGNIRTDISLRPEKSNNFKIKGLINGTNINLGEISGNSKLFGRVSMEANIDGYASSFKKFAGNLTGKIDSIEINRYTYRNIALNGFFTEKTWDGNINIEEENIRMELLGKFNFSGQLPEFNFTLDLTEANLYKLNFDPKDTTSSLSMLLTSNFKGNNIDNLNGEIKLLNSRITKYNNNLDLKDFSIKAYAENNKPVISLRTDFADADLKGSYSFSGLGFMTRATLARLMPSVFDNPEKQSIAGQNNFTFAINFKNTDKINNFFRTGLLFSEKSYLNGIFSTDSIISITGNAGTFSYKNNVIKDLSVAAYISESTLTADINTTSLTLMGQTELKGFSVNLDTKPDSIIFSVDWDNKDKILNRGKFGATGTITRAIPGQGNPILKINIDSSDIYVRNNLWIVKQSDLVMDSTTVKINNLYISNNDRYYQIDGSISEDPADTLRLRFNGIDISPLNYLIKKSDNNSPDIIPLNFKGSLKGSISLTNIYKDLLLESNIRVNSFSMLDAEYGDISLISEWDILKKVVKINASNNLNGMRMMDIGGFYDPSTKGIDLTLKADKLPIEALNPLLKVFASGITGFASGNVRLSGSQNNLVLTGAVMAQNASLKIDYLQTRYKLNDTVRFDKNGIRFNNLKFTDEKGNNATITGTVYHKSFKDFKADLTINTKGCMVLNTKPKDNELFYGTAYATGVTTIKSDQNSIVFDISARTDGNTKFYIPLNSGLTTTDYPFITFIDANNTDSLNLSKTNPITTTVNQTAIDFNLDLEVTPDAEVKLIFDSKVGDEMTGTGSGNLNINLDRKGNFKISGDYIIDKGDYLFTLRNILNKSFKVENGGKISFNGDIDNAEMDIKATYSLTASLYEILPEDKYKERTDVACQLYLTGKLFNPAVKLNIDLPNADEETKTYLKSMINTEEELNRQFFYLLVMNSFLAPTTSTSGTSAMAVTTTEMLSNQISNWLSQISNDYKLNFAYRPGNNSLNSQELEVALSTQLLNNKVLVNVRGTSSTANNANQISGDFDAEVKITEKIRFKVFNRYNNPYTGKQADYTQGLGLFFSQEFNKFGDLFRKKEKSDMKKEEVPTIKEK